MLGNKYITIKPFNTTGNGMSKKNDIVEIIKEIDTNNVKINQM